METSSGRSGRTSHRVITASVLFSVLAGRPYPAVSRRVRLIRLIAAVRCHRRAQRALAGFYTGYAGRSDGLARAEAEAAAAARDLPPWLARRL